MNRKLLVIHPNHCVEVMFDQQLTIGRDVYNSLCLQDPEVSRSHAIIFEQESEIILKDLKSRNGVYINGDKVGEQLLSPGDEIVLGATVMLYEPEDSIDLGKALSKRGKYLVEKRAKGSEGKVDEPITIFSCEELDLAIDKLLSDGGEGTTFLSLTNSVMLLQAMKTLDATSDARGLFNCALEQAMKIMGGHRAVIMETDDGKEQLKVRALRSPDGESTIMIGEPILRTLLETEKCLYSSNVTRDRRYSKMAAKADRPLFSFVAAPIRTSEEMFGFIYLDSKDEEFNYDYNSLRSLYMIASHVGALLHRRPMHFPKHAPAISAKAAARPT
jgi:pSer/pThr/pTyr-binding forkhead associated (FHA) protein